ncbi:MAG: DNA translocase FtsK 4TM domain-containing protein, partial [Tannerella sp.]|nr:DNA translocase FtsK 4TM domain-containing protein [Tannerella sp.]
MPKKRVKKNKNQQSNGFFAALKHYSTSRRVHFVMGLLLSFFTAYVGIALISFIFTGAADQSIVKNLKASDLILKKIEVSNWAGVRGAYIADWVMNKWFGISSFFLLFLLGSVGFKIMNISSMHLFRRFIVCVALTVWSSVFLAFVSSYFNDSAFFYLGGQHGYDVAEWLIG